MKTFIKSIVTAAAYSVAFAAGYAGTYYLLDRVFTKRYSEVIR